MLHVLNLGVITFSFVPRKISSLGNNLQIILLNEGGNTDITFVT